MKKQIIAIVSILLCSAPAPALAWGNRGHGMIDRAALQALPADGPVFLRRYADYIAEESTAPDNWRGSSEPFSKIAEDPNHTWFVERLRFLDPVPRSRYAFVLALYREHQRVAAKDPKTAERLNVRWTGTLPYAVLEGYGRIVSGMREYRQLQAKGENTANIEQTIAFYVAWMGHYVGDAANPMHVSIHCEGWHGPNEQGYTRDGALHGRFESDFVNAIGLSAGDIAGRVAPTARQSGDVFENVLAYVQESNSHIETIFQLDKRGAFQTKTDRQARDFVYDRAAFGAAMLRDLLYRAWLESAHPGGGGEPRPQDPTASFYDPETGTAPAP